MPRQFRIFRVFFHRAARNLFFHDALYRKRIVIVRARADGYAKHCNSCLLIISASISRSKPPANADRTLSLSQSPHFVLPPLVPPLLLSPCLSANSHTPNLSIFVRGPYATHKQRHHHRPSPSPEFTLSLYLCLSLSPSPLSGDSCFPPYIGSERMSCRYDQ